MKKSEGIFREELISKILEMCSRDRYSLILDFTWLSDILVSLATLMSSYVSVMFSGATLLQMQSQTVADMLVDIALRVEGVRPLLVRHMLELMIRNRSGGEENIEPAYEGREGIVSVSRQFFCCLKHLLFKCDY